jgi:RecA-family ATPase
MNRVEKDVVHWVWKNWIPLKKLTVLDGDPGLGKSTLLLDIAARLSRGAPMPDDSTGCGGSALLLTAEDGLDDTVRPRLEAANADLERIVCLRWIGEGLEQRPPAIPDDVPALEQLCLEENVRLVVIDPLVAFLANSVDTASDQNVRRVLHLLARVAERCNCAVVLLRHLNKGSSAKAIYRGGGSIGIIGAARSGLLVAADPGRPEGRVLAVTKSNLARPPQSLGFRLRETPLGCC